MIADPKIVILAVRTAPRAIEFASKDIQGNKLQTYDWYYIRKTDAGTAVPSVVQTYRDGVRTKATEFETAIAATTTSAELQALDFSSWPSEPEV